jgi:hypothetical protein
MLILAMEYKHKRGVFSLVRAMNNPPSICIVAAFLLCSQVLVNAEANQSVASVIEQAITRKKPNCRLISSHTNGGENPNEAEKTVNSLWKCNGKDVSVSISNLKTEQAASTYFIGMTITPIMRRHYNLSDDGKRLKQIVDKVGFYRNESPVSLKGGRYRETYDVTFRKGKVVVFIEAFRSGVAQELASVAAESLPAV